MPASPFKGVLARGVEEEGQLVCFFATSDQLTLHLNVKKTP